MPQLSFPFFPEGSTLINASLAFEKNESGQVFYFNGGTPVFSHDESDTASFKMITAQFCATGTTKQVEIVRAFGVTAISVKRAVKRYREQGAKGFFTPRKPRGPAVLTPKVIEQAQSLLDEGLHPSVVAEQLGIKKDTLSKAVRAGRLKVTKKKT